MNSPDDPPQMSVPPALTPPPPLSQVCSLLKYKYMETCRGKEEAEGQILPPHTKYRALSFLSRGGYSRKENSKPSKTAPVFPSRSQGGVLFQHEVDIHEWTMNRWELGCLSRVRADLDLAWLCVPNSLLQNRRCVLLPSCIVEKEETR